MNVEDVPSKSVVSRWRWWIHFIVIGGYFIPGMLLGLRKVHRPMLSSSTRGMLIVSAAGMLCFALVFAVGWAFSRATHEQLLFHWRPGWWVVPLGIGYSIALRVGLGDRGVWAHTCLPNAGNLGWKFPPPIARCEPP
jgi:hypothetical protein